MTTGSLPKVSFAGRQVSRMLLGGNPFSGHAHKPNDPDARKRLLEYFTDDKVLETMQIASGAGINAFHGRGDENVFRWLANFRAWSQGQADMPELHWLAQTAPDRYHDGRVEPNIEAIAAHAPMAIYVHGATTQKLYDEGKLDDLAGLVQFIKSLGFPGGIGAHDGRIIHQAHEMGMETDFYVLSLRTHAEVPYICADEQLAAQTIQNIPKQFVAIKVLAAGRLPIAEAFSYAATTLKPDDLMSVGMFDYEVEENARKAAAAFTGVAV